MTSLRNLSMPLRVLFSCFLLVLGIGYLAALAYLFLVDVEPHASKEGSWSRALRRSITASQRCSKQPCRARCPIGSEARISGVFSIWVRAGAKADDFARQSSRSSDANCVGCHSAKSTR